MLDDLIPPSSLPFEEALRLDSYNEDLWIDYLELHDGDLQKSQFVLDRAVAKLPASVLLWNAYLQLPWQSEDQPKLIKLYERALVLNLSPALWTRYLAMLVESDAENAARGFDGALFALPVSYHSQIWELYLRYADSVGGKVGAQIYARYFGEDPERCVLRAAEFGEFGLARVLFLQLQNASGLAVAEFCDVLVNSAFCDDGYFETLATDAAVQYPDLCGDFFLKLARYYSGRENPEKARHFFTQGLRRANSVREVTALFDEYADFEENMLSNLESPELELRMDHLDRLLDRRPLYLSDVKLKKDPNLVDDWLARAQIYQQRNDSNGVLSTYVQAISSINPLQATSESTLASLWIRYADVYILQEDFGTASIIFSRAVKSQFKNPDELADLHIAWTEMLLQTSDEEALAHVEAALANIPLSFKEIGYLDASKPVQSRIFKSVKLWTFYIDLLKSMADDGDQSIFLKMDDAYAKMVTLRIISLNMLLEYATFLREHGKWDRSLAVYESGLRTFNAPRAKYEIWNIYLTELLAHDNISIEKARDLFDQCLTTDLIPGSLAKPLYLLYSDFEQKNGSVTKSVRILDRGIAYLTRSLDHHNSKEERNKIVDDKHDLYCLSLEKVTKYLKDTDLIRSTYAKSLEDPHLTVSQTVGLTLRFIDFEAAQRELRRVRALFKYATKLGNPASHVFTPVWAKWEKFEVENGSEDTFKEMLRFKRQITKEFESISHAKSEINPMGFVKGTPKDKTETKGSENPDAIELDMDM